MRTYGRTDRHDEANSRFPQFCELAYKRTICLSNNVPTRFKQQIRFWQIQYFMSNICTF